MWSEVDRGEIVLHVKALPCLLLETSERPSSPEHTGKNWQVTDGLKGCVFEVSLADLQNNEVAFRKFRLISEDIQGKNVLTNFHGMTMTTDKLRSLVKSGKH